MMIMMMSVKSLKTGKKNNKDVEESDSSMIKVLFP